MNKLTPEAHMVCEMARSIITMDLAVVNAFPSRNVLDRLVLEIIAEAADELRVPEETCFER